MELEKRRSALCTSLQYITVLGQYIETFESCIIPSLTNPNITSLLHITSHCYITSHHITSHHITTYNHKPTLHLQNVNSHCFPSHCVYTQTSNGLLQYTVHHPTKWALLNFHFQSSHLYKPYEPYQIQVDSIQHWQI